MPSLIPSSALRCCLLIWLCLLLWACSSPNDQAPATDQAHPPRYILSHAPEADADLTRCRSCHGSDLNGGINAVGCFTCHDQGDPITVHQLPYTDPDAHGAAGRAELRRCFACHGSPPNLFDGGILSAPDLFDRPAADCSSSACHPDAGAHPTRWQGDNDITADYLSSHRPVTQDVIDRGCAMCHQVVDNGPQPSSQAPSCFSSSFTNADNVASACHANGPAQSHYMPFIDPQNHGAPAKSDMARCQKCHGTPGTIAFDGGIAETACSSTECHPDAGAHPTRWQGTNDITGGYSASHRTAAYSVGTCGICHDVNLGRTPPNAAAPSCYSVDFTNSDGSATSCHAGGPNAAHDLPYTDPEDHGATAKSDLADCQTCHGTPGTTAFDGGSAFTDCSSADCHPDAGAHPTRWQGTNDITGAYISTHRNAASGIGTCGICHDVNQGRTPPNPSAPSCYSSSFTNSDGSSTGCHPGGPVAAHDMPYTDPHDHGPAARSDLADCQTCHGTPGTTAFDGGSAGTACSSAGCHPDAGAHPTRWQGGNDITGDYSSSHRHASVRLSTCGICHDVNQGRTPPNPSAPSCYSGSFTNSDGSSTSCHSGGPDDD